MVPEQVPPQVHGQVLVSIEPFSDPSLLFSASLWSRPLKELQKFIEVACEELELPPTCPVILHTGLAEYGPPQLVTPKEPATISTTRSGKEGGFAPS